jgi:hypothetical protein
MKAHQNPQPALSRRRMLQCSTGLVGSGVVATSIKGASAAPKPVSTSKSSPPHDIPPD